MLTTNLQRWAKDRLWNFFSYEIVKLYLLRRYIIPRDIFNEGKNFFHIKLKVIVLNTVNRFQFFGLRLRPDRACIFVYFFETSYGVGFIA